jgi:hypothetical protein
LGSPETQFNPPAAALENRPSRFAKIANAATRHNTTNPKADFFIAREFTLWDLCQLTKLAVGRL